MRHLMITITCILLLSILGSDAQGAQFMRKLTTTELLSAKTLKWSFIANAVLVNSMRMAKEADHFDDRDLLPSATYHAFDTIYIAGLLILGYQSYAIIKQPYWTPREKACLFTSAAFGAWEAGECTYKGMRWDNPYDNNPLHNKNAIPCYSFNGSFHDAFLSTGKVTTLMLHMSRTVITAYTAGRVP